MVEEDKVLVKHWKDIRKALHEVTKERNISAHTAFWGPEGVDIANVGLSTMVLKHSSEGANLVQKNVRTGDLVDFKAECDLTAGAIDRYILHSRRESSLEI